MPNIVIINEGRFKKMQILKLDELALELEMALEYFATSGEDPIENETILEQITATRLILEGLRDLLDGEERSRQLSAVVNVVQNLHLCKIAETGTDLLGNAVSA